MNGLEFGVAFYDQWTWAIFVTVGLLLVLIEVIMGVDTAFDLVIIGSILVLAGAVTLPLHSWWITLVIAVVLSVLYLSVLRRYVRRHMRKGGTKTNIDAYIGQPGIVLRKIGIVEVGRVRIGSEEWRASSDTEIQEGETVTVTGVKGITLIVSKKEA